MTSISITPDYQSFIEDIKSRILSSRYQAARVVNKEIILLYHHIGTQILKKQKIQGWGSKILENMSKDLKFFFPGMKGFSTRNLNYMRLFAEKYTDLEFVQQVVAQLAWGHIILITYKIDDPEKRTWYIEKAISGIWSRDRLDTEIETDLYSRQGKAITNFQQNLPLEISKDATHLLKSPYNLDFLCLTDDAHEREIEAGMVKHIEKFLLELGDGFAFMGSQYLIRVDNDDYFMDMLFYNVKLRAYVVVELKAVKFTPSFVGQLNFYLSAVDSQMKHPNDNPSIGILLCKSQKGISVEYALRDVNKPIGVAEYRLTESLPEHMKTALPSIEELEFELSKHAQENESSSETQKKE